MKRLITVGAYLALTIPLWSCVVLQWMRSNDLQHQVLQLQAQTKWLEEAIVPKHLQGSTR